MTQAPNASAWCAQIQAKLMTALEAEWKRIEHSNDPAELRRARDKAKAIGDLAAMARKVALIVPPPRPAKPAPALAGLDALISAEAAIGPVAAQAEPSRRALDRLKGGGRARL